MEELKPCPFCGDDHIFIETEDAFYVYCATCYAQGPLADNEYDAVAGWNHRAAIKAEAKG